MTPPALQVSGLRKTYSKNGRELPILEIDGFSAREGEFVTVIGPSGCGKSTFLHMLGGFISAEGGSIQV